MYKQGVVSVIVPCYNGAKYIDRFINAILTQSYRKIELLLINDGSIDESEEKILSYRTSLEQSGITLKYYKQDNQGLGATIQKGLNEISGEFFTWFGIDDWPRNDYMEKAVNFLTQDEKVGVVRFDGYLISENDQTQILGLFAKNNHDKFNRRMFENAIEERNFHFGYSVVRTKCFDIANRGRDIYLSKEGQNWQILLPVFYYYEAGFIDEPLYYVIEHADSISRRAKSYDQKIVQIEEYQNILLQTLDRMKISDGEHYKTMVKDRFAKRIFLWAVANKDFKRMKEKYQYLKKKNMLTKEEKKAYNKAFWSLEFVLYIKHKIFG